jgi:hypothetical protein
MAGQKKLPAKYHFQNKLNQAAKFAGLILTSINRIIMSKDRQAVKEKKKPAAEGGKKAPSDYQSGKANVVKPINADKKK